VSDDRDGNLGCAVGDGATFDVVPFWTGAGTARAVRDGDDVGGSMVWKWCYG
jgi:hypothetical protein